MKLTRQRYHHKGVQENGISEQQTKSPFLQRGAEEGARVRHVVDRRGNQWSVLEESSICEHGR
jgi:hypothetical protein